MQDLHQANNADTTLTKLLDVDSTLAEQEVQLQEKLKEIQEKRKSLESVITMFSPTATPTALTEEVVSEALGDVKIPVITETKNGKSPSPAPALTAPPEAVTEAAPKKTRKTRVTAEKEKKPAKAPKATTPKSSSKAAPKSAAKTTTPKSTAKTTAPKSTKTKAPKTAAKTATQAPAKTTTKTTRRSQDWQQYVRDEFSKTSLPEAVSNVLQRQSNDVVGIPEMIDAIFLDEMPKQVRSKASNRISNILSTGLKDNKWYRGKTGHYSISRNAAMADLAS